MDGLDEAHEVEHRHNVLGGANTAEHVVGRRAPDVCDPLGGGAWHGDCSLRR